MDPDGADPFDGELLHFAAQDGNLEEVRRLVAEGRDINAFDSLGMTPLHYAVKAEHFEVAQFLIEHGANVNAHHEPTISNTPLGDVAATCSLRMARLLVDAGADPTIRGWMQLNAIDRAESRKRGEGPDVYRLLLRAKTTARRDS
jgi:ankyrin repeat protein